MKGVGALAFAAALIVAVGLSVKAMACNAMSGSADCGPYGFLPGYGESRSDDMRRGGSLPPMSTLGGNLSGTFERPGTIGAITFGSGGRKCSGMFRSVNC